MRFKSNKWVIYQSFRSNGQQRGIDESLREGNGVNFTLDDQELGVRGEDGQVDYC